jgi:hypothetical protein
MALAAPSCWFPALLRLHSQNDLIFLGLPVF